MVEPRRLWIVLVAVALVSVPLAVQAGKLYWSDKDPLQRIARSNLDGSDIEDVIVGITGAPWTMTADAASRKLFWIPLHRVWMANLDGSEIEELFYSSNWFGLDIELDAQAGTVWWTNYSGDMIERIDVDGTDYQVVLSGRDQPSGLGLDPARGKFYWSEQGDTNTVFRADLDGSDIEIVLRDTEARNLELDLDRGKIYWIDPGVAIRRANLDGTGVETVIADGSIVGITLRLDRVNDRLYWDHAGANDDEDVIYRANLDGSDVEIVVSGLTDLRGLAVVPESFCGDGVVDPGEACDDGNQADGDGCQSDCVVSFCGDGILDFDEECDDGNNDDGDGCSADCTLPCGDGVLDPGEECDDGNNDDGDGCQGNCLDPICGDGIVDPGEECDDGNDLDFDGCQSDCTLPPEIPMPQVEWAGTLSLAGWFGSSIDVDTAGNTVVVLCFQGTIDADPGPGVLNLTSDGIRNTLIVRLDPRGALLTAGLLTGDDTCARDVVADDLGNVYAVGFFENTADVDPGPGVVELTTAGSEDNAFAIKLDAAGNLLWARQTDGRAALLSAATHGATLFATGVTFEGTDLDPGPGILTLPQDPFVWALDADGNLAWAVTVAGGPADIASRNASVYLTGSYSGTTDFDPGPGVLLLEGGCGDTFVTRLSAANGDLIWARGTSSPDCEGDIGFGTEGLTIAVDSKGSAYVGGTYEYIVDFDPGPGTYGLSSGGLGDRQGYVWKLDSGGNFGWVREIRGMGSFPDNRTEAVDVDGADRVYALGTFNDTVLVAPGVTLTSAGGTDAFIVKYTAAGEFRWTGSFSGPSSVGASGIAAKAPALHLTGSFKGIVDFDPGPGIVNRQSTGEDSDTYIVKLSPSDSVPSLHRIGRIALVGVLLSAGGVLLTRRRRPSG